METGLEGSHIFDGPRKQVHPFWDLRLRVDFSGFILDALGKRTSVQKKTCLGQKS
ncbi:hypothetical protein NBRC116594_03970 [Shimia sp. NS0008-38b]